MKINKKIIFIVGLLIVIIILVFLFIIKAPKPNSPIVINQNKQSENIPVNQATTSPATAATTTLVANKSGLSLPIGEALTRVTKKPFGIYVTPQNSPVSPEHFSGYHTGVDFETTAAEKNKDVPVYTICSGSLALKKVATGYGGVAVQSCTINKEAVTVIYGHLRISSVTTAVGVQLSQGQQIAVLGTGYSTETAGERKHLHLGIHKGTGVVLLGYVSKKSDLNQWLDFLTLVK